MAYNHINKKIIKYFKNVTEVLKKCFKYGLIK